MNSILLAGSIIVTLALASYSIGIIKEQRSKIVTKSILIFLGTGLIFDITGTICMLIGSTNNPFTFHGFIGYSALSAMFVDNILLWRIRIKNGYGTRVNPPIHTYSFIAYIWWILVYISGFVMVING